MTDPVNIDAEPVNADWPKWAALLRWLRGTAQTDDEGEQPE